MTTDVEKAVERLRKGRKGYGGVVEGPTPDDDIRTVLAELERLRGVEKAARAFTFTRKDPDDGRRPPPLERIAQMTLSTEEEAAEKWCPYGAGVSLKLVADSFGSVQPITPDQRSARCIGSRCMAWRVGDRKHDRSCAHIRSLGERILQRCDCDRTQLGYCGAFGKVEP